MSWLKPRPTKFFGGRTDSEKRRSENLHDLRVPGKRWLLRREACGDKRFDAREQFPALLLGVGRRVDRRAVPNDCFTRPYDPASLLLQSLGTRDGHRHDRNPSFHGHIQRAALERTQAAVRAPRAFGK